MIRKLSVFLVVPLVFALAALIGAGPALAAKGPIKIGLLTSKKGVLAKHGSDQMNALKVFREKFGDKVAGRDVKFFVEDTESIRQCVAVSGSGLPSVRLATMPPDGTGAAVEPPASLITVRQRGTSRRPGWTPLAVAPSPSLSLGIGALLVLKQAIASSFSLILPRRSVCLTRTDHIPARTPPKS